MSNALQLSRYPLVLWNDSAIASDMRIAVKNGCRGGTTNPPLILKAARENARWSRRACELSNDYDTAESSRRLADEIRVLAAKELLPVFERTGGREGFLSAQVDPHCADNIDAMVAQAVEISHLAPNIYVKIPLTATGLTTIKQLLQRGISVTATVSFTLSQVLAVTQVYSDVLRDWQGEHPPRLGAVLMVGRLDDYLRALAQQRSIQLPESIITQAGVAVAKRAYSELRYRNLPGLLVLAAPRGLYHITEFLEMDAVMTAGASIRQLAYDSFDPLIPGTKPTSEALDVLRTTFPEFVQAYEPDGIHAEEFESYGATRRTLDEFISAQEGLERFVSECSEGSIV